MPMAWTRTKHFGFIILMSTVVTALILVFQAYVFYQQGVKDRDQALQSVEKSYLDPTAAAVFFFEQEQLNLISGGLVRLPYIDAVSVYEYVLGEYQPLLRTMEDPGDLESFDFALLYDHEGDQRHIGKLTVYSDLRHLRAQVLENLKRTAGFNLLILLGMAVCVWWLTKRAFYLASIKRQLEDNTRLMSMAASVAKIGGWVVDLETDRVYWSDEVCRIHDMPPGSTVSVKEGIRYYAPEYRERIAELFEACARNGMPYDEELEILNAFGKRVWVRTVAQPIRDFNGRIVRVAGAYQEVTQRRQAEQRLQESEAMLRAVTEASPDPIFMSDGRDKLVYCNPAFETTLGFSPEALIGRTVHEALAPERHREAIARGYADFVQAGPGSALRTLTELEALHGDGREVQIELSMSALQIDGRWHAVGVMRDITRRKQFEQVLSTLNRELARLGGDEFFGHACRLLCEALGTDIAFVGLLEAEQNRLEAFAGWTDGHLFTPFYDDLAGTLCANVIEEGAVCYPEDSLSLFPDDPLLKEIGIEACVGHKLIDKQDRTLGILLTLGRRPLTEQVRGLALSLLGLFVDRVASEIQRSAAEKQLRQAANVFHYANEGILITTPQADIIDVNAAFTRITGYERHEVLGQNPRLLKSDRQGKAFYAEMWRALQDEGSWTGEIWNRHKDGDSYAEMLTISAVRDADGTIQRYVGLFSDITQLKEQQRQLEHMAHFDALTGLPNRVLLADRLQQAMALMARRRQQLALVYIDLDSFKRVNDHYGHDAGDRLLVALAEKLQASLRDGDTLARLGGDEFVAVLLDLPDVESARPLLRRLLNAASCPVSDGEHSLQVCASLGVSLYPQAEPIDADQLLRQADQAMYQAKLAGGNRYHLFDVEHDRYQRDRHEALEAIRQGLENNEFVLFYQPKVAMATGVLLGAEALIRWQHPERGLLPPVDFLPQLAGHPLMVGLGDWVIEAALAQISQWREQGHALTVSVNVDALQLTQSDFVAKLRAALARYPAVQPGDMELEVIETSALRDIAHISSLIRECRGFGVSFSLDDFGTGYSSLTYLKRLPVETLKIDQSFVRDMLDDPDDLAILHGVIGLAESFQRGVIAEGVETEVHGQMLLQLGCKIGQGYAIAKPMPAEEMTRWHARWQPHASWSGTSAIPDTLLPVLFGMVAHRAWMNALKSYAHETNPHPPELSPQQLHFGRWLASENSRGDACYRILTLHEQVYQLGCELVVLTKQGDDDLARKRLAEVEALHDRLMEAIWELIGT
ncbi:PAS/PAC and GAF sensor-containing diguanylate cyclase/phosphodiesterase [Ectothiorhodospira sp. PHS-1]|uniref:EAL domain-containing protein n=1 Tax=Ectothiorhodospira sp. PHS-1 TaxID=519989 RepID=UPI00024A8950|nr:EAL domain-containing protein [Ectothiorhodospira sp. PHS-1]EHQ53643.1 PAS/PAC and GAF sensor-containing diguanylate cyclase/phosphodiesterase [Ectothiorhodospira sp. PHS-1]